jgi:hypothetical protein
MKSNALAISAVLLVVVVFLFGCRSGQGNGKGSPVDKVHTFRLKVVDQEGRPIDDIRVLVKKQETVVEGDGTERKNEILIADESARRGSVSFRARPDTYRVFAQHEDYAYFDSEVPFHIGRPEITLTLARQAMLKIIVSRRGSQERFTEQFNVSLYNMSRKEKRERSVRACRSHEEECGEQFFSQLWPGEYQVTAQTISSKESTTVNLSSGKIETVYLELGEERLSHIFDNPMEYNPKGQTSVPLTQ